MKKLSIVILCILFIRLFPQKAEAADGVMIYFFHNNPCESCQEGEHFVELVKEQLLPYKQEYPYEFQIYSTIQTQGREFYLALLEQLGKSETEVSLPVMVLGDHLVSGYEEIGKELLPLVKEADQSNRELGFVKGKETENDLAEGDKYVCSGSEDTPFLLFTTFSCAKCEKVKQAMRTHSGSYSMKEINITEDENVEEYLNYMKAYGVPEKEQQVPILLYQDRYASGEQAILELLDEEGWWEAGGEIHTERNDSRITVQWPNLLKVLGTGVINGMNPCALSMFLLLLSILIDRKLNLMRYGIYYFLGKVTAYFVMGTGLFSVFQAAEGLFFGVYRILRWLFVGIAVILALLNFLDCYYCIRGKYGKIRMQLPRVLRKWNQNRISESKKWSQKRFGTGILLLGGVVSVGEFFCTGQIYAAALLYLLRSQKERIVILGEILGYCIALCIPALCLLIIISKGNNIFSASEHMLKYQPYIKFLYGILFLAFAVLSL